MKSKIVSVQSNSRVFIFTGDGILFSFDPFTNKFTKVPLPHKLPSMKNVINFFMHPSLPFSVFLFKDKPVQIFLMATNHIEVVNETMGDNAICMHSILPLLAIGDPEGNIFVFRFRV